MRTAYDAATVRAAEEPLLATPARGHADGSAPPRGWRAVCAGLLGTGVRRPGAAARRRGDNGGDALYAGARLAAARRPGRGPAARRPGARGRPGRVAPGGRPGRRRASAARADLVVDGLAGHRRPRRPARAERRRSPAGCRRTHWSSRSTCPAASTRRPGEVDGAAVRADVTVTFGALKPGLLVDPGAEHAGVVELIDIGLDLPPADRRGAAGRRRRRAAAAAGPRSRTSTAAASSASPRARPSTPAPPCLHRRGAARRRGDGALRRRDAPAAAGPGPLAGGRGRRGPGAGLGGRARAAAPTRPAGWPRAARRRRAGRGRRRRPSRVARPTGTARRAARAAHPARRELARLLGADRADVEAAPAAPRPRRGRASWARSCCSRARRPWWPGRTAGCGSTRPARRRWPPRAPATCWPGCAARCWPAGSTRSTPGSVGAWLHGLAGRLAADGRRDRVTA